MEFLLIWIGIPIIGFLFIQGSGAVSMRSTVIVLIFTAIVLMALWFTGWVSFRNV